MVLTESSHLEVDGLPDKVRGLTRHVRKTAAEGHEIAPGGSDEGDLSIKRASRRAEEDLIRRALAKTGGNRTRAAELLEISHRALLYKIKEYGIAPARGE
jgi:two-component system response regulator AtoC